MSCHNGQICIHCGDRYFEGLHVEACDACAETWSCPQCGEYCGRDGDLCADCEAAEQDADAPE